MSTFTIGLITIVVLSLGVSIYMLTSYILERRLMKIRSYR